MFRLLLAAAGLLVLPLSLLLFAQWPLRDFLQAGSRQANDLAQVLFALYMAVAVTAATRAATHLSAGHAPAEDAQPPSRWKAWAVLACTGPWALFLLWTSAPGVWQSIRQLERFSDTLNPGFFVIRIALWAMAVLVLVEAVQSALRPAAPRP